MRVGRKRESNFGLPAGVREIRGRWYYSPTTATERGQWRREGKKASVPLGMAGSVEARKKWAEATGHRDPSIQGKVAEILTGYKDSGQISKRANGKPLGELTVKRYTWSHGKLLERFGPCVYGKTEHDAARGKALGTPDVQRFVVEMGSVGNLHLAVLKNAFDYAIRQGLTVYNPCDKVVANAQNARTREPQEWEVECLRALASPRMALMMDYEAVTGDRVGEILAIVRSLVRADGIHMVRKGGKRDFWEWTPELRRIVAEAAKLPGASVFPASPLFPTREGKRLSYNAFHDEWTDLKAATNAALAECEIPLAIEDLHFHDLRSKAHDDAEEEGRAGNELLGNTERVARKHYSRREKKRTPRA